MPSPGKVGFLKTEVFMEMVTSKKDKNFVLLALKSEFDIGVSKIREFKKYFGLSFVLVEGKSVVQVASIKCWHYFRRARF